MSWWRKIFPAHSSIIPDKIAAYKPFDTSELNAAFEELQSAVVETTALAGSISTTLEERLTFTEQKLSAILCVLTEGVVITNKYGKIKEWNPGAEIIFGYTKAEMVDQNIGKIAGPGHEQMMMKFVERSAAQPGSIVVNHVRQVTARHKDGNELYLEISINVLPELDSDDFSLIAIIRDVTEKIKQEHKREDQRRMLETILTSTEDVVIVKDAIGRWILMNEAGKHLYGMNEADFMLQTDEEIGYKFPHFKSALTQCIATDKEAWAARKPTRSEEITVTPDGKKVHFDVIKTPTFDATGHRHELVVVGRDVTQLKEKRQSVTIAHKALNASSDMVCIVDDNGHVVFVNEKFIRTYKFVDYNDIVGKKMNIVRHPSTPIEFYERLWGTVKAGRVFQDNLVNKDKLGNDVRIQTTIMPIVNDDLSTPYFICVQKLLD